MEDSVENFESLYSLDSLLFFSGMNMSYCVQVPSTTVGMSILSFGNNMLILCEFLSIYVVSETPS
jgi:hypothetical protein